MKFPEARYDDDDWTDVREPIDLDQLLDRGLELSDYRAKGKRFAKENQTGTSRKAMGIAAFLHGAGFTGSGERYLASVVGVEGCADGGVRVLVSSTEFGQGTKTVLCQIAAEALGLTYEQVGIAQPDTDEVPNMGPDGGFANRHGRREAGAVGSVGIRQTLVGSGLLGESYSPEEFRAACRIRLRRMDNSGRGHTTKLRATCSGMMRSIAGRHTRRSPGRSMSPR